MGRVVDPETGLIYLRNRYYDPTTAQFLSRDPLTSITGSPYGYVNDNPLNDTDPTGLLCVHNPFAKHSNCRSFSQQHPLLVPVLATIAVVAAAPAVIAYAGYAAVATGTELASTAAASGGGAAGVAAAAGQVGLWALAGSAIASALAIPVGIAWDLYSRSHGCPSPTGVNLINGGIAGTAAPPSPVEFP